MRSAFGVEHTISKKQVPDSIAPVLPSTTVLAYNNSQRNKTDAAARNLGAKVAGTAVGIGGGYLAYRGGLRKIPALKSDTVRRVGNRMVSLSAEKKQGYAASVATGAAGGVGGYIGSKTSLERIKRDKKYRYKKGR